MVEITLKYKYRAHKSKGTNRASYVGRAGKHRVKHGKGLLIPYRITRN